MTRTRKMTKDNGVEKSKNGDRKSNANGSRNQVRNSQATNAQSNAILNIKQSKLNELKIKASVTDSKGCKVKEMISNFRDGDAKELFIDHEKKLLRLGLHYDLFRYGRWRQLAQIGRRLSEDAPGATGVKLSYSLWTRNLIGSAGDNFNKNYD